MELSLPPFLHSLPIISPHISLSLIFFFLPPSAPLSLLLFSLPQCLTLSATFHFTTLIGTNSVFTCKCWSKLNKSMVSWESVIHKYLSVSLILRSRRPQGARYTTNLLEAGRALHSCLFRVD